jgi:hypothetical protein
LSGRAPAFVSEKKNCGAAREKRGRWTIKVSDLKKAHIDDSILIRPIKFNLTLLGYLSVCRTCNVF